MVAPYATAAARGAGGAGAAGASSALGWAGLGVDIAGGIYGQYASAEAARDQWKHQKKMMQKRYQWQTEDMKKAGLNPMLAAGASPPGGQAALPHYENPMRGTGQTAAALARQSIDMQLMKSQVSLQETASAKNLAEADEARARKNFTEATTPAEGQFVTKMDASIANLQADTAAKMQAVVESNARTSELIQRVANLKSENANLQAVYDNLRAQLESIRVNTMVAGKELALKDLDLNTQLRVQQYVVAAAKSEAEIKASESELKEGQKMIQKGDIAEAGSKRQAYAEGGAKPYGVYHNPGSVGTGLAIVNAISDLLP